VSNEATGILLNKSRVICEFFFSILHYSGLIEQAGDTSQLAIVKHETLINGNLNFNTDPVAQIYYTDNIGYM